MATDAARPPESEPPTAGDGDGDGGGEAAWCTDQQLQEKVRRTEEALASGIAARLPDRGEKLRRLLRQLKEELDCRRRLRLRPPPPRPRPPLPPPRRDEDDVRCDRLIQSRCAETSDFMETFGGIISLEFCQASINQMHYLKVFTSCLMAISEEIWVHRCCQVYKGRETGRLLKEFWELYKSNALFESIHLLPYGYIRRDLGPPLLSGIQREGDREIAEGVLGIVNLKLQ